MNISIVSGQIAKVHVKLETAEPYELYGGTTRGAFSFESDGETWHVTAREEAVAGVPLCNYDIYARELATGREWVILSGKIVVKPRTASVPADKLHPVEYFVTVPVRNEQVDAAGNVIVQGVPGPKGERGEKGEPGEGGMTDEERALLNGAAQRDADNTFSAGNTFTGEVDMSGASVTPPEGWNVGELTAEAIQKVVPMAWITLGNAKATASGIASIAVGGGASAATDSTAFGQDARALGLAAVSVGKEAWSSNTRTVTIGASFHEEIDGQVVWSKCRTEGTGSITIGAGANTLNNGDTESSNSVTIGCKASNQGADSVVIGAQAKGVKAGAIVIGAGAEGALYTSSVSIGRQAKSGNSTVSIGSYAIAENSHCVVIGSNSSITSASTLSENTIVIGTSATASAPNAVVLGANAKVGDAGATVIRSTAEDGTYTQLYFSGANTPLANTYHDGAPMLGYVTKDSAGNIVAAGTRSLIDLLTDNSTFQPASLDENGEWVMPRVFHPSDLDLPTEEPTEPEEYQPLPVYPIVEPEIEPLTE